MRRGERDVPAGGGGGRELARAGRRAGAAAAPGRGRRQRGAAAESAAGRRPAQRQGRAQVGGRDRARGRGVRGDSFWCLLVEVVWVSDIFVGGPIVYSILMILVGCKKGNK